VGGGLRGGAVGWVQQPEALAFIPPPLGAGSAALEPHFYVREDQFPITIRGLTVVEKPAAIGIKDDARNISNKIGRGSFTAVFFVQYMEAIGCHVARQSR
jgi:hypothetical protein